VGCLEQRLCQSSILTQLARDRGYESKCQSLSLSPKGEGHSNPALTASWWSSQDCISRT
jgi:hypothetical protein